MSYEFNFFSLDDVIKKRNQGVNTTTEKVSYSSSGIPVIRAKNIRPGFIDFLDVVYVDVATFERVKDYCKPKAGDVLYTNIGDIGNAAKVNVEFDFIIAWNVLRITPNEIIDSDYLVYLLGEKSQREAISSLNSSSTVPFVSGKELGKVLLPFPNLKSQCYISSSLRLFDDRITLLRETNATLEAIAQALFKSWFVDFDPVRAKAEGLEPQAAVQGGTNAAEGRMPEVALDAPTAALFPDSFEESELGLVPKGWSFSTVGLSFILTMGQSPPGDTYNEIGEGLPFYQGRTDFGFRFPKQRIFCTEPTRLASAGDTLVSVRAPVGDVNIALEACALGRGVAGLRHPKGHQSYVFYAVHCLKPHFEMYDGEGTVFGSINKKDFQELPVVVPSDEVLRAFEAIVAPLDAAVENNEQKLRSLTQLRDTLLPRLISGQLRLPNAEQAVEEALA